MSKPVPLTLRDALRVASKFHSGRTGDTCVIFERGRIRAASPSGGCDIPCDEAKGVEIAVDGALLAKVLGSIGDHAELEVKKGKLVIAAGDSVCTLSPVPEEGRPTAVLPPKGKWTPIPADSVAALVAISARAAPQDSGGIPLTGMRITPAWAATADTAVLFVAWCEKLVENPVTMPANVWADLKGDVEMLVEDNRVWLREVSSGQARWTARLVADWPDATVNDMLTRTREQDDRVQFNVSIEDVGVVARQADALGSGGAKLTLSKGRLAFEGASTGAEFRGGVEAKTPKKWDKSIQVGILPAQLVNVCATVGSAGGDEWGMSVVDATKPVMAWGGSPIVIEALVMPYTL